MQTQSSAEQIEAILGSLGNKVSRMSDGKWTRNADEAMTGNESVEYFYAQLDKISDKEGLVKAVKTLADDLLGKEGAKVFNDSGIFEIAWKQFEGDIRFTGLRIADLIDSSSEQKLSELKGYLEIEKHKLFDHKIDYFIHEKRYESYVTAQEAIELAMEKAQRLLPPEDRQWFKGAIVPKVSAWAGGNAKKTLEELSGLLDQALKMDHLKWRDHVEAIISSLDIVLADDLRAQLPSIIDAKVKEIIAKGKDDRALNRDIYSYPFNVTGIVIGGSLARGEFTLGSDVDIVHMITMDGTDNDISGFINKLNKALNAELRKRFGINIKIELMRSDTFRADRMKEAMQGDHRVLDVYPGSRVFYMRESNAPSIIIKSGKRLSTKRTGNKNKSQLSKGGIDLTPANMNLQTKNAGEGIKFHMDAALLAQLQNAPGFVPVIINIQPLIDIRSFLGIKEAKNEVLTG